MTSFSFYLLNLSFRKSENLTIEELRESIEQLGNDCQFIRDQNEKIYREDSIYEEIFWDSYKVMDINYPEVEEIIGQDYKNLLQIIIDRSTSTSLTNEEVLELLTDHSDKEVNGLICLHKVNEVDEIYCVYSKNDWYKFHRYFLGLYPISDKHYSKRCEVLFPNIILNENILSSLSTVEGGFQNFAKEITSCLAKLNDEFFINFNPNNVPESLKKFSAISGYETTNEGSIDRKSELSFSFKNTTGVPELIYCEPHMKLFKSDNYPGDSRYYYNRIHFHPGKDSIGKRKILVGHIGRHL